MTDQIALGEEDGAGIRGAPWKVPAHEWRYRLELVIHPEGRLEMTRSDEHLLQSLGFDEIDQNSPTWWMNFIPQEDIHRTQEAMRSVANGTGWEGRVRVVGTAGETRVLEASSEPTKLETGSVSVVVHLRDVTEIASLEAQLDEARSRLILVDREVPAAWWSADDALRYTWSSGSALASIGHSENSLVGMTVYELFDTEDVDHVGVRAYHRALAGEDAEFEIDWMGIHWRAIVQPAYNELGMINGVIGVAVDMSGLLEAVPRPAALAAHPNDLLSTTSTVSAHGRLQVASLIIDRDSYEVRKEDRKVPLTVSEFKLLVEFALNAGRVLTRDNLAERVWGHKAKGDSANVTMAISRLRDKIEDDPSNPRIIETVRGVGYRMSHDDRPDGP